VRPTFLTAGSATAAVAIALAGGAAALAGAAKPSAPHVAGNLQPGPGSRTYVFSSSEHGVPADQIRYLCALDHTTLQPCTRRLTVPLAAGTHVLRVRAVDQAGRRSPLTRVTILVRAPVPELRLAQVWQVRVDPDATGHNFFDIAVGSAGRVYVADSAADRIDVYDADGTLALRFGSHGSGPGEFSFTSPDGVGLGGVGIDPATGTVYVADSGNRRIETFTPDGTLIGQWGADTLGEVIDVAPGQNGAAFTVEDRPNSVKQFTAAGVLVRTLPVYPTNAGGIALGGDGSLLVADYGSGGFTVLDGSGKVVRRVQILGNSEPSDIAGDAGGTVYVTDSRNARVDVFDATGKQTGFFRTLDYPTGIALGANALYVTTYDGTLTKYALEG